MMLLVDGCLLLGLGFMVWGLGFTRPLTTNNRQLTTKLLAVSSRQFAVSAYCELPTANQTKSGLQPGKLSAAFALLGIRKSIYRLMSS